MVNVKPTCSDCNEGNTNSADALINQIIFLHLHYNQALRKNMMFTTLAFAKQSSR